MMLCAALPFSRRAEQFMAMPAITDPVTTIDHLLALPYDGQRHELLDGVHVVTPAPLLPHQRVIMALIRVLDSVCVEREDAELFMSPADVILTPRTLVQPDVFIVRKTHGKPLRAWSEVGIPLLAIEILSPSTASRDRGVKRRIYQSAGVGEYWIVDLDARLIERWAPGDKRPEVLAESLAWTLPGGASGVIDVEALFATLDR
jgi:Uma2 family endonuclease